MSGAEKDPEYNLGRAGGTGTQLAMEHSKGYNPTIRENLDNRIKEHKRCIEELERIKASMPENMIDMKISDLRSAMQY